MTFLGDVVCRVSRSKWAQVGIGCSYMVGAINEIYMFERVDYVLNRKALTVW